MLKHFLILCSLLLVFSCGKTADEKTEAAILSANIALSKGKCVEAINGLEGIGRQNSHARYLKTLASAYACKAGFSAVTFLATDIGKSATPAPFGGVTLYTTSQIAVPTTLQNDLKFIDLQKAINILAYAGGIPSTSEPSSLLRANYFTGQEAADINSQLLFMMLAQLGKFMHYYADAGATGVKGAGPLTNVCFADYPNVNGAITAALAGYPGACNVTTSSHPDLDSTLVTPTVKRVRMCQGIVLLNGIIDILPSVVASVAGGDLNDIAALTAQITAAKTVLTGAYPQGATVAAVLSQSNCESDLINITDEALESYFAIIFEALIK